MRRNKKKHENLVAAHLDNREFLVEERLALRRVKKAEEGSLRAHTDVDICARAHARLWVRAGGGAGVGGYGEVGRGVEFQEHARGD